MTSVRPDLIRPMASISLKWNMVQEPELSIRDKFMLLRDLGYDGVELDAPNELDVAEVIAARDASGLAIPGVVNAMHWKAPLTDPDPEVRAVCVASIITALENARDYGASTVLVVPGVVNATTSYTQAYQRATAELFKVLDHAEQCGVSIAIENVWNDFLLSPLEAARFIDQFDHARIGWYFDVGPPRNGARSRAVLRTDARRAADLREENGGRHRDRTCDHSRVKGEGISL